MSKHEKICTSPCLPLRKQQKLKRIINEEIEMKKTLLILCLFLCFLMTSAFSYANRLLEAEYLEKINLYHDEGIEKSNLALNKTQNNDVKKIAKKMIRDQSNEREQVRKLRMKLYSDIKTTESRGLDQKTNELKVLTGKAFDKMYLELMAQNHKEEILITGKMLPEINRAEVHHMAIKIAKNKGNEIDQIEKIKKSLE